MGHFSITVATGDLSAAESSLSTIGTQLTEEGGKLAGLPGKAADWTGGTSDALKAEMSRIGKQMERSTPHFEHAKTAVATFRHKLEDAETIDLPKLNTRWDQAQTTHDSSVTTANTAYTSEVRQYKNMPDSDSSSQRQAAGTTRDNAIAAAGRQLAADQKSINGDYDALITELQQAAKTCGSALAAAVLVAVPSSVVDKYIRGCGTGTYTPKGFDLDALTVGTRQALTGDNSLAGQADDHRAGLALSKKVKDWLKNHSYDTMPKELRDELAKNAGNTAFTQAFMTDQGPAGMARIAADAKQLSKDGDDQLYNGLSTMFATGSKIQVTDPDGTTHWLMDEQWLDHYNPEAADKLWQKGDPPGQYRPDLLLPFLAKKGISEHFAGIVGDRAMSDYEKWVNRKSGSMDGYDAIKYYLGDHANNGVPWDSIGYNQDKYGKWGVNFQFALARAADYPDSANKVVMGHFDAMMGLMTGKAPWLTGGGDNPKYADLAGGSLGDLYKQSTTGMLAAHPGDKTAQALSDSVVSRTGAWLKDNTDSHFLKPVRDDLTNTLTNKRYVAGLVNSLGTPFGPKADGYDPVTGAIDDPRFGPLMPPEIYQALHREAMRDPNGAAQIITTLGKWITDTENGAQHMGYTYGPDGKQHQDPSVSSLDYFRAEAVRNFMAGNLVADKDALNDEMQRELEANEQSKEKTKAVLGTLFSWAKDPASIKGDLVDKAGDFVIDKIVDATSTDPADIQAKYQSSLDGLQKLADNPLVKPSTWDDVNQAAGQLAKDEQAGTGADDVRTPQPGYQQGDPAHPTKHTGNPLDYVGKRSETEYNGGATGPAVITDDFLTYDKDHHVTGTLDPSQMNYLQRDAYMKWLQDPATQKFMDGNEDAIKTGRERATQGH